MTKIITCCELRYLTLAELEALFRTLQIELGRASPGSRSRERERLGLAPGRRVLRPSGETQLAGIGGIFGERRLSPPRCTQGCALSQKISLAGLTQLASSSVPAIIIVIFGMISASSMSADPHAGQKRR